MSVSLDKQLTTTTEMWCGRSWDGLVDRRRTAFAQAQLLRSATNRDSRHVVVAFLEFFHASGEGLLRDEEDWIFRSLQPTPEAVKRALDDHLRISSLVSALTREVHAGCIDLQVIHGLGELLERHLLLEEEEVRPLMHASRALLRIGL